jgi:RNA polymerase sigma-70 factor (sigma-E family)
MREPAGFAEFVRHESPRLLRAAHLLTHDWHAAEDLVQTALINALPRWGRIDHPDAYVRRAMLNAFLSGRERRWTGEVPTESLPEGSAGEGPDADVRLTLLRALAELPRQQRAVITLRFFDDQTEPQTAALMGLSLGTVKSHSSRALAALRAHPALKDVLVTEEMS